MSINKNFVVKHGLEVDKNLILADADVNRVGIGTTIPKHTLHVNGGIGATSLYVSGISTVKNLVLDGSVSAGGTTGKKRFYLTSTGTGVTWSSLSKNSIFTEAFVGQTTFYINYQLNTVEVYVNGVRLAPNEFEAIDGTTVVLISPCFGGEIVEILANDVVPLAEVGIGITVSYNDVLVNGPAATTLVNFTGTGVTVTSASASAVNVIIDKTSNPPGKTIYIAMNGSDSNDGLTLEFPKRTLKAAAAIALAGDTIKVSPGTYIENNPITLAPDVSVEGAELRNCIITPNNPGLDLFWVSNGNHITDLSFQGQSATGGASVVAFKPLVGVASDRFFDAARMIRYNLDYIASEAVGYLTSTDYKSPAFSLTGANYTSCKNDIKNIFKAVCHDITRGGNSKSVGAGLSYYDNDNVLQHIVGVKTETIDTIRYAAGITRSIINNSTWGGKTVGIATTVVSASYNNVTGIATITATNHGLGNHEAVKIVGLGFTCPSGVGTVYYPSGNLGYVFPVNNVIDANTFEVVVGQSTLPHTYVSGGTIQKCQNYQNTFTQIKDLSMQKDPTTGSNEAVNGCANVVSAIYSCVGVVTTIINQGPGAVGTLFNIRYPGNSGIGTTDPNYIPSQGVGNVTKGPYVRNCTNFIPNSIGMKVDGFHADPGDNDDMGITGMMSVDSYTQYNQGGIGVEISNGAYAQLVSIFTICNDKAIVTKSGGQCDVTNSNSSFGTYGLVSEGLSFPTTKSNYHYTGHIGGNSTEGDLDVIISGIGNERPYSGQVLYFNELYYEVESVEIVDGGSGYTEPPSVIFTTITDPSNGNPSGPSAIKAEAIAQITNGSVTGVTIIGNGRNYRLSDSAGVTFTGPSGPGSAAIGSLNLRPIYYKVRSATVPSAGVSTVTLANPLNNDVGIGSTAFLFRQSLQIVSSHSFEYIGAGNTIGIARPSKGGVTIQPNEVVKIDGGEVVYTSTDQDGNFAIGDDLIIDQATGTIRGRAFERSLLNTVTPFIIALGAK